MRMRVTFIVRLRAHIYASVGTLDNPKYKLWGRVRNQRATQPPDSASIGMGDITWSTDGVKYNIHVRKLLHYYLTAHASGLVMK